MKNVRALHHRIAVIGSVLLLAAVAWSAAEAAGTVETAETVILRPDRPASWRPSKMFAFLRPGHNYGERSIEIETIPSGATIDLFYIRANFQKRYEQAESPAKVILPNRADAGPRDAVTIRAFAEGYRQKEVSVRVASGQDEVLLELEPLPNTLVAVSHTYFAGRASLGFLTEEPLTVRIQDRDQSFSVILAETAKGTELGDSLDGIRSPLIDSVESLQLGEDLLVQVKTPAGQNGVQLRARQSRDELRDLYVYSVDMIPTDGGVELVARARRTLASITTEDVSGCAIAFDSSLRGALDPAALSRALAPRGAFTDPYLRAAMKRLGEVSPNRRIAMVDGSSFNPANPIELAAAMSQAAEARGYLALLRTFVNGFEAGGYRAETLRSLLAPEIGSARFGEILGEAGAAERSCRRQAS
jgi:hypothetical protein